MFELPITQAKIKTVKGHQYYVFSDGAAYSPEPEGPPGHIRRSEAVNYIQGQRLEQRGEVASRGTRCGKCADGGLDPLWRENQRLEHAKRRASKADTGPTMSPKAGIIYE